MKKYKTIAVLIMAPIVIWLTSPFFIRKYIEKYYPNIVPEKIIVHPTFIEFSNVNIKYGQINGVLNKIYIKYNLDIHINGGEIYYKKSNEKNYISNSREKNIYIKNVNVTAVLNNTILTLANISYENNNIIESSSIYGIYENKSIVANACKIKEFNDIACEGIYFDLDIPFKFPEIKNKLNCSGKNIKANKQNKKLIIELLECGELISLQNITFNGLNKIGAKIDRAHLNHKWLGSVPVEFANISLSFLDVNFTKILIELNKSSIRVDTVNYSVEGSATCSDWVESLPNPKQSAIENSKNNFTGNLSFKIQIKPEPKFTLHNKCSYKCSSFIIKEVVSSKFKYYTYNNKNERVEKETGPGIDGWVKIEEINPHTVLAFVALEDPSFHSHNGILPEALQNSFVANIKTGKFMRGGSTITMQLAKNLWLTRDKTITRKVEEALLTVALESCLTKDQILELYLNVIEFGPNIYGIGKASKYYFGKYVSELTQAESFYLASLLPNPRRGVQNPGLEYTQKLMGKLKSSGFVLDEIAD